jgi:hypothetical protein
MKHKIDPQYEEHLLENVIYSDDPEHLARYIEEGGALSDNLREYLAKLIRDRAPKPRGNSDPLRDLDVYFEVESWRQNEIDNPIREEIKKAGLTGWEAMHFFLSKPRKRLPSRQKAYEHFTLDDPEANIAAIQKQYERGRDIINPKK